MFKKKKAAQTASKKRKKKKAQAVVAERWTTQKYEMFSVYVLKDVFNFLIF